MPPEWINNVDEFRSYVFNAHSECINAPEVGYGGEGIHIGILDSIYAQPGSRTYEYNIRHRESFVESEEGLTTWHGFRVFDLASHFAPDATFSFYQIVDQDGNVSVSSLSEAVSTAISHGVDIVNISAGQNWDGPIDLSPFSRATQPLLEEGITTVAAAGNHLNQGPKPSVYCPAALDDVIAVAACVTNCPASMDELHTSPDCGPYYHRNQQENTASGIYCGYQGCTNGESCFANQVERPWKRNPEERNDKPDVLAPMHYPFETDEGGYEIDHGTSFSAPIVTGALADAFSDLRYSGDRLPTPAETRRMIRQSTVSLDEGDGRKLNVLDLKKNLESLVSEAETQARGGTR